MPNFIEIGQTNFEKSVKKRYRFGPSQHFFVTDGQKRDYLSRVSQRARGATKTQYQVEDENIPPLKSCENVLRSQSSTVACIMQ